MYVQNFSQKQLKERYFGILFVDHSIFVLWTRENFDSWNVYKEGISSQNEAIYPPVLVSLKSESTVGFYQVKFTFIQHPL